MKLTPGDHQAIRSAGFTPAGGVFGNQARRVTRKQAACAPQVAVAGRQESALAAAVRAAVEQVRAQCVALGADGVIGISVAEQDSVGRSVEVLVTGTAVRADGDVRPARPFLSDLSCRDFAKLLHNGWVPCDLVLGIAAVIGHDPELPLWAEGRFGNRELRVPGDAKAMVQRRARKMLRDGCGRVGAEGVVLGRMTVRAFETKCLGLSDPVGPYLPPAGQDPDREGHDVYAEALFTGTAISSFRSTARPPLTVLPLHTEGTR